MAPNASGLAVFFIAGTSLIHSSTAHAADCNAVLVGIHDRQTISQWNEAVSSVLEIIEKAQASSYEEASQAALDAGFTLPDVPTPFKLGLKSDKTGKGNWASQFRSYLNATHHTKNAYQGSFQTANKNVVEAWTQCVLGRTGIILEPDEGDDETEVLLHLSWKSPDPTAVKVPKIKSVEVTESKATLVTTNVIGQLASSVQNFPIKLKRVNGYRGGLTVTVYTDNVNYQNRVKIRKLPEHYPEPAPSIAKLLPDFDGNRQRDLYETRGDEIIVTLMPSNTKVITKLQNNDGSAYNAGLGKWLSGDFDADGCSDLAHIPVGDHAHFHISQCNGEFAKQSDFIFGLATGAVYNASIGNWRVEDCRTAKDVSVLVHDPNLPSKDVHYWVPTGAGTQFRIITNSCN